MECLIDEVCPSHWFKSGCVTQSWCITMLFFQLLWTHWATFLAKNSKRSILASTAFTQVSHWSHNSRAANHHQRYSRERKEAQRRTKISFGRTMMQALEQLWLVKRHVRKWSNIKQQRNQACIYSHYLIMLVWRY